MSDSIFHTMLYCLIPLESILWPRLGCLTLWCWDTVFIGCCGTKMFFHTVYPDILSVVFAVTKGRAWQTVLQHGEGRPEDTQQRGRGGDGMPLLHFTSVPVSEFVLFSLSECTPPFLPLPFRSCRATDCVVGGWPWWALGCCVQGASFSYCSIGCQSGASNPPALVPQFVMLKWYCCAPR